MIGAARAGVVGTRRDATPDSAIAQFDAQADGRSTGSITSIPDQENSHNLSGAAELISNGINGNRSYRFNGSSDIMDVAFSEEAQPNRIYIVFQLQATQVGQDQYIYSSDDGNARNDFFENNGNTGFSLYAGSSLDSEDGSEDTSPHIATNDYDGGSSSIRLDGTQIVSGNPGSQGLNGFTLGARYADDFFAQVDVGEVVLDVGPSNDVSEQEQRLADNWGISLA